MKNGCFKIITWVLLFFSMTASGQSAQESPESLYFSYTHVTLSQSSSAPEADLSAFIAAIAEEVGGAVYAIWSPVELSEGAPFSGLNSGEYIAMLRFDSPKYPSADQLNKRFSQALQAHQVTTRIYAPVDLRIVGALSTPEGFYVHRDEHYSLEDMNSAVSLSQRAWSTWEAYWQVKVVGLFRQIDEDEDVAKLNRIVWYPSYEHWQATRNNSDTQSAERFRERRQLLIEGSGAAVATNRL